jgi:hypothetical protein
MGVTESQNSSCGARQNESPTAPFVPTSGGCDGADFVCQSRQGALGLSTDCFGHGVSIHCCISMRR